MDFGRLLFFEIEFRLIERRLLLLHRLLLRSQIGRQFFFGNGQITLRLLILTLCVIQCILRILNVFLFVGLQLLELERTRAHRQLRRANVREHG